MSVSEHSAGGYNFYVIAAEEKRFIIGGVPERYAAEYTTAAAKCDAVVLLTSNPKFTGGIEALLDIRPDIEIYGGSAALRNIKEIVNRPVNEKLIKDNMTERGLKFLITPGLIWVDTVTVIYGGSAFCGQLFSGGADAERYYRENLAVNRGFALDAAERISGERVNIIYPATGSAQTAEIAEKYIQWAAEPQRGGKRAAVIYSSTFGYTRLLAERIARTLSNRCEVSLLDAEKTAQEKVIAAANAADILAIGTRTENRNAPAAIWDVITRLDLMNKRGTPYFVFGSFGWAGDGTKLIDKTLSAMGLRRAAKPVEVLFKPTGADIEKAERAAKELLYYEN